MARSSFPHPLERRQAARRRLTVSTSRLIAALAGWVLWMAQPSPAHAACPLCNPVSQTIRQEMAGMDAVVITQAIDTETTRDTVTGAVRMKVTKVLKGKSLVRAGDIVTVDYYGKLIDGQHFKLAGVEPQRLIWSVTRLSEKARKYVERIPSLPEDEVERLSYFYGYLQDEDPMLRADAYDEFAIAPYDAIKKLGDRIRLDDLYKWLDQPELPANQKRLFLMLLGTVGSDSDLPMLEKMLRNKDKAQRGGLDAMVACYLTLAGEKGLPLINKLFLESDQTPYSDTYAAVMAIRFHGTEGDVIPRSALVESLHLVLNRPELADLVIPDLARWKDWSQIAKVRELFLESDEDNNWVRVPIVLYLRACPKPEADKVLAELEKFDPETIKRANTYFAIPVPTREPSSGSSSSLHGRPVIKPRLDFEPFALPRSATASRDRLTAPRASFVTRPALATANPWRLAGVVSLATMTFTIAVVLLISGPSSMPADR